MASSRDSLRGRHRTVSPGRARSNAATALAPTPARGTRGPPRTCCAAPASAARPTTSAAWRAVSMHAAGRQPRPVSRRRPALPATGPSTMPDPQDYLSVLREIALADEERRCGRRQTVTHGAWRSRCTAATSRCRMVAAPDARAPAPLQEKMTLFWHGHFTSDSARRASRPDRRSRRTTSSAQYALGNIARADAGRVARSARCCATSTTRATTRAHPNENYARELMELFTLGIGNYTRAGRSRERARVHRLDGTRSTCVLRQPAPARRRHQDVPGPDRQLRRSRHRRHHLPAAGRPALVREQTAGLLRLQAIPSRRWSTASPRCCARTTSTCSR